MSRMSEEEWDRKKWYLLTSLFEEEPRLSPISEREELSLGSPLPEPEDTNQIISRPFSPLPDLIIEKEPSRHDEPEEFYYELEREMMQLYRILFLDSENSSHYSDPQSNDDNNSDGQVTDQHCYDFQNNEEGTSCFEETSKSNEERQHEEISNEIMDKTKSIDTSMEGSVTSESDNNDIIVTQALVHREESDKDSRHRSVSRMLNISSEIQNQSAKTSSLTNTENSEEHSEDENMQTDIEDLRISNIEQQKVLSQSKDEELLLLTRSATGPSSSLEEPEIMRRRETSNDSEQSINALDVGRYLSASFSNDNTLKNTDVREMEEAEESSSESSAILRMTSTPKIVKHGDRKRRISLQMYSPQRRSPLKRKKLKNVTTQTSFGYSKYDDNWSELKKHFFKGTPRICNLQFASM